MRKVEIVIYQINLLVEHTNPSLKRITTAPHLAPDWHLPSLEKI
jgi:hypothetical protein